MSPRDTFTLYPSTWDAFDRLCAAYGVGEGVVTR